MKKNIFINSILFLFFVFNLQSYSQENLTLNSAIQVALQNNYSIKIAKKEALIDSNNLEYGIAGFFPDVLIAGRLNKAVQDVKQEYFDDRPSIERKGAKSSLYEGTAELNWTIFDGMKMFIEYDRLGELREIGELRLKSRIESTIRDVTNSYYNILTHHLSLEVVSDNLKISRKRYEFVNDRFEVGTASKIELLQAGVDLNADISDSLDQQINYDNLKIEFNRLLNRDLDTQFNTENRMVVEKNFTITDVDKPENNIDVIIAKKMVEINRYDIESLQAEFYPTISLYTNYNYNHQDNGAGLIKSSTTNGLNYGVNLSFSLFDRMNTSRQIENAKVNTQIADDMLQDLKSAVSGSIRTSLNGYTKFKELSQFENQNVEAAKENMELALVSLNLGLMSALEFRETQRRLSNARLRLITSIYNAKINETELLKLTGSLLSQ